MSCFFDAIRGALTESEMRRIGVTARKSPLVIAGLKRANRLTRDVTWQGARLRAREMRENFDHVRDYDAKTYTSGYLTSSADPFLLLCSQLFRWNINFSYMRQKISIAFAAPALVSSRIAIAWPAAAVAHEFALDTRPVRAVSFSASNTHFSCP